MWLEEAIATEEDFKLLQQVIATFVELVGQHLCLLGLVHFGQCVISLVFVFVIVFILDVLQTFLLQMSNESRRHRTTQ